MFSIKIKRVKTLSMGSSSVEKGIDLQTVISGSKPHGNLVVCVRNCSLDFVCIFFELNFT